jgi:hypothetical protein
MRWLPTVVLSITLLGCATTPRAPARTGPATPLLGDRLRIVLPEGARLEPRPHSIMAADAAETDETRALLEVRGARFMIVAIEEHVLAGDDLLGSARAMTARTSDPLEVAPFEVAAPLTAVAMTPRKVVVDPQSDSALLLMLYVRHPDGLVQVVGFVVDRAGATADPAGWTALARATAATLTAGPRRIDLRGGERRFASDRLALTVPDGFVTSTQEGPDFAVHHVRKVVALDGSPVGCGIYAGGHPSYQHAQQGVDDAAVREEPGSLLGAPTSWHVWEQLPRFSAEAMLGGEAGVIHVFCSAPSPEDLAALRTMMGTLRRE